MVKMMKMYVRIYVFPLHMCAFAHIVRIPVYSWKDPSGYIWGATEYNIGELGNCVTVWRLEKTVALLPIGIFSSLVFFLFWFFFFFFLRELFIPLTQCPVSVFSFLSFNFKADEKNNEGEEQEVRDDNHPKRPRSTMRRRTMRRRMGLLPLRGIRRAEM